MPRTLYTAICLIATGGLAIGHAGAADRTGDAAGSTDDAIRQAEAKYEAALKAAEARLQEAHETFREQAAAAREQFLADIAAARTGAAPDPAPAEAFGSLPVSVPSNTPAALVGAGDSVWTEVPATARGAVIFEPPGDAPKDGVVEFTVLRDAKIGLAASWAYDGNSGGGWQSERLIKQQLAEAGWIEVGKMYRGLYDRHTVFYRQCRKGETFRIRTRKYLQPYVLVPGVIDPPPAEAEPADPAVVVEVPGSTAHPVVEFLDTLQVRKELANTRVYDSGVSGVAVVRVRQASPVYVAASWEYDGNDSGQWTEERWTKQDFEENGWKEIGIVKIPHRGRQQEHTLFVRACNKGEEFRLRTRKYGAPFVFVPVPE